RAKKGRPEDPVSEACRLTLGREPGSLERHDFLQFLDGQTERIQREKQHPKTLPFIAEQLPEREGKAALLDPNGPQRSFEVPTGAVSGHDFTVEAIVLAKTIGNDSGIHAIASHWSGNKTQPGWAFGVAGKKSPEKGQHLALQLASNSAKGGGDNRAFSET